METADATSRLTPVETAVCTCTPLPWMTVQEAALAIGRSDEYLYAGLRENRFPGAKFGRAWSIPREFIRAFVADAVERGLSIDFEEYAAAWKSQKAVA
jgi:excisionase family DNA binding protein